MIYWQRQKNKVLPSIKQWQSFLTSGQSRIEEKKDEKHFFPFLNG
jgi:hypothetical protein